MSNCLTFAFLSVMWICIQISTVSGVCPDGRYGLDCSYTCHCTSGCDDVTGCSGNCKKRWAGPTCNMNNLALNKPAFQSSHYNGDSTPPSNGVDGDYTSQIFTDVHQANSWWEVDLEKAYYIHNVTVHFRRDYKPRRNGVQVYRSLERNQTKTYHLCGAATIDSPDVTRITCNNKARYIKLYQGTNNKHLDTKDHNAGTAMDFSEVEVFICDAGTFGDNCTEFCHCQGQPCNYTTGECVGGCKQNWTEKQCDVCDSDHYGLLCNATCSNRHCDQTNGTSRCDNITGQCDYGCQPGYTGTDCTQICHDGMFGSGCKLNCSERHCDGDNTTCDAQNGTCEHSCKPGWKKPRCMKQCRAGMFGAECKLRCSERHCDGDSTTCDAQSGTCKNGCRPGWKKPSCMEPCDTGLYGASCVFNCTRRHCLNTTASCDHVNGSCGGQCEESWMGDDCIECRHGMFGSGCKFNCSERHCDGDNTMCDAQSGTCQNGCTPGWKKPSCTKHCDGTYGRDCSYSCRDRKCRNSSAECDHVTGSCGGTCQTGWKGDACTQTVGKTQQPESGNQVVLIASISVAAVVVIAVVVIVVVFLRWRRKLRKDKTNETLVLGKASRSKGKTHEATETNVCVNVGMTSTLKEHPICHQPEYIPVVAVQQRVKARGEPPKGDNRDKVKSGNTYYNVKISDPHDEDITDAVAIIDADDQSDERQTENDVAQHDAYYNNPFSLPEVGFDMTELESVIQQIRNQRGGFEAEFLKLPSGFKHPYAESQKPQHKRKNRFIGYYPYDNNRVVLSKLSNYPDSDYINASHVDAYNKKDYFIAAQAPREGTVVDFWRMIWEQDCGQIIMLTNLMEAGKHKCEPYWDDDKPMAVSFFNVAVKETFHLAEYSIRKIQVTQTKSGKLTQKTFDHYHFTSWPDHGVPNVLDLLDFLWKTRDTPRPRPGPVLVHCSAGIGRTGTYIALQILIDEMNATGQFNILQTISKMRHQRKNMIQTKEQYECVFITLLEVVKYGQTSMPTNHYLQGYPTQGGNLTMGRKTIDQLAEDIVSMNSPYNADAQVKNRLWVNGQQDQFVVGAPSQLLKQGYLLAHTPYRTENLLWKLITENDSLTLITLGTETGLEFIPHPSHVCEYGRVTVATVNETRLTRGVTLKTLSVGKTNDPEKKEIANYSVDLWSDESDSSSVIEYLIILMEQMENRQKKLKSHPVTIVFNVSDTQQAISLCIMNNIMSTISIDKEVEIFNNVRRFQDVLPNVEFTEESFRLFCQLAFVYLESIGVYTNI